MTGAYRAGMELLAAALVAAIVFVSGAWGALALWYHGSRLALGAYLIAVVACIAAIVLFGHAWPLVAWGLVLLSLLGWWWRIAPSNDRDWADDVARTLTGRIDGDMAQLSHVRDFRWTSEDTYQVRWTNPSYDLSRLQHADAIVSYWGLRSIAHAMVSFAFDDGRHLVFSVEIRKKRGQAFSAIGGFFKQYEMILIAATEPDIIGVRTNMRMEDTYLLPLNAHADTLRSLFVAYVDAANRLAARPEWYNTITSNCTTLVYRMARRLNPGLPMDIRLLATGYLPEYLRDAGAVDAPDGVEKLRQRSAISERARAAGLDGDFSAAIRTPVG
ncbi:DUF4105 domain-containing protein [Pinirhizobacter soli]|uniref:Lnb N-terminal periplasmic domain-containing protein n=1 Tax=Pinirhizobacter soli TaxID=2786953 RepID=UPI002029EED8|nr:DUF4105 domain-containing protein [Pinirhizobacter soli]